MFQSNYFLFWSPSGIFSAEKKLPIDFSWNGCDLFPHKVFLSEKGFCFL